MHAAPAPLGRTPCVQRLRRTLRFPLQLLIAAEPSRIELTRCNSGVQRASCIVTVLAIAKAAVVRERLDIVEHLADSRFH